MAELTHDEWIQKRIHPGDPKLGNKQHVFVPCRFGTIQVGEKCKPSYHGIESVNKINDTVSCGKVHVVEITADCSVLFNGAEIARAPEPRTVKGKGRSFWPPAKRKLFCQAVVWSIIPRNICVFNGGKNGGKNGAYETAIDDAELLRYASLYPALISNQDAEMQQIMNDELPSVIPDGITIAPAIQTDAIGEILIPRVEPLEQAPVSIRSWSYMGMKISEEMITS
jgi:hypothetical protein